ncbi:MAG TPA: peptidoglycan recognition family protein [Tepidisphaeraceae bacterium]|nr:peptidoglycan recognition family protein [Tepidisphaeraceae bacterium]
MTKNSLVACALAFAGLIAGCQSQDRVATLPPPRFTGPTIQPRAQTPIASATPSYTQPRANWSPKYLPGIPNDWIPRTAPRQWKYIVIHHSASTNGSIALIDREHKDKGWDGIGYHFLIGNGHGMGDGEIDPTPRWPIQKWGAHTKTPDNRFNDFGIGICMVGNFDFTQPSPAQIRSVSKLVAYLMRTYNISPDHVYGHGQCKPTDCPGRYTNVARIKQLAVQQLADSGYKVDSTTDTAEVTPSTELMQDTK